MKKYNTQNVCFITGTLGQGGAERQLFYYLQALQSMGISTYVLCLTSGEFWENPIRELGIPVIWVGRHKSKLLRLVDIIKTIKSKPVDIIQSQHFHANLYAAIAARLFRIPSIGALRSDVYREILNVGKLGNLSLSMPDIIVANSQKAVSTSISLGIKQDHLFYFPNFVDENKYLPNDPKTEHNPLVISYIGTLWAPKRVDRVVTLAKACKNKGLNILFKIFGDGVQLEELKALAKAEGVIDDNLEFSGRITDSRVAYQSSDILLLTSDHEGTPNVVLEAMSSGLPVISSNVGDVSDLIKDGINGYLFDPADLPTALNSIEKLYYDFELRRKMGKENRQFILENRSLENIQRYFRNLYGVIGHKIVNQ